MGASDYFAGLKSIHSDATGVCVLRDLQIEHIRRGWIWMDMVLKQWKVLNQVTEQEPLD